ncbi:MAG: arsenate reductase ArsC [Proteobacteria bacterium]|nr:arsenate reductase ArsC [Pseudomonadota bacterium]
MNTKPINVLFLCAHNAVRSIMAEAILNREGMGRFKSYSAGPFPRGEVHPQTISILQRMNYDTAGLRSKHWDEFTRPGAPEMDFVFTVCDVTAGETCPVWPGEEAMQAHWPIPDPLDATGTASTGTLAFAEAFRSLDTRISIFVNLRLDGLDRMRLQSQLDHIGGGADRAPA